MDPLPSRRLLMIGALALPLLGLPACTTVGDYAGPGLAESVRRLLTASSRRAFARLLTEEGFFADDLARVDLPRQLESSGAIAAALLRTNAVRQQLLSLMNRAASEAAEAAAPVVYTAIRDMSIADAAGLARGGPTAATDYLQRVMGTAIVDAMFPGVGSALRLLDNGVINQLARAATGIDFSGLQRHVAEEAAAGIYRAIGREEAAIRANPGAIGDPLIARLFGGR
ncbi:MAG TPA: DUF4197 domain-containing protein [Allosphingosinicella sp.]